VQFTPSDAGDYQIEVTRGGQHVQGSPAAVKVTPKPEFNVYEWVLVLLLLGFFFFFFFFFSILFSFAIIRWFHSLGGLFLLPTVSTALLSIRSSRASVGSGASIPDTCTAGQGLEFTVTCKHVSPADIKAVAEQGGTKVCGGSE
jgi:hypothetical protein